MTKKQNHKIKGNLYILFSLLIVTIFWTLVYLLPDYEENNCTENESGFEAPIDGFYEIDIHRYNKKKYLIVYGKYYYVENDDKRFDAEYYKISEENIEMIKFYYDEFRNEMIDQESLDIFDLDEKSIDYNNYYIIHDYYELNGVNKSCAHYPNFNLQLYDTDNHILYLLYVG